MVGRMIQTVLGMPFLLRCASHMIWPKWDGGGFPEMSLGTSKWCEEQVVAISWSASHTSSRYHGNPWKGSLSTSISVLKSVLSCSNFHPNDRMPVPFFPSGRWWCWAQTMSISVGTQCRGRGDMEMRKNETRWAKSGRQITVPAGCQMHDLYWFILIYMDIYGQLLLDFDDFDGVNLAAQWNAEIRPECSARNLGISMIWNGLSTNRLPKYLNHDI